eukprot:Hpha_TRINITY_DN15266_c0_g1::TRINITY_DN15266_c0_g1_i1::g.67771::m.67771
MQSVTAMFARTPAAFASRKEVEASTFGCNGCQARLLQGARFCHRCGKPAGGQPESYCHRCGVPQTADSAFCHQCGTQNIKATPTPTPAPKQDHPAPRRRQGSGSGPRSAPGTQTTNPRPPVNIPSKVSPPSDPLRLPPTKQQQLKLPPTNHQQPMQIPPPVKAQPPPSSQPPAPQQKPPAVGAPPQQSGHAPGFGRQVPWWERRAPWAREEGKKEALAERERMVAPWLLYASLPQDSSVGAGKEIDTFADFVCATAGERSSRVTLRATVQTLALQVSPESTVKVIGGWGTGLAEFDSGLDLVVEAPGGVPLADLAATVAAQGIAVEQPLLPGGPVLAFSAAALAAATSSAPAASVADFRVTVRTGEPGRGPRAASMATSTLLSRRKQHRATCVVIRHTLRHFDAAGGGLGGYAVSLLALAYVQHRECAVADSDPGSCLRGFFEFYSAFDFASRAIRANPAPGEEVYPLRPSSMAGSPLCILDPVTGACNVGAHTTAARLRQLQATLQYTGMLIKRYDVDQRNLPLLPNLLPAKRLVPRLAWLRDRMEVTKALAVSVARGVADFLEDPNNLSTREELLQIATWDTLQGVLRDRRVSESVVLGQNAGSTERLARALDAFCDEPEVRAQHVRAVSAAIEPEMLKLILGEVSAFMRDPECAMEKEKLVLAALFCGGWSSERAIPGPEAKAARVQSSADILRAVANRPGSVLAPFRNCTAVLAEAADTYYESDLLAEAMGQCATDAVTRDFALAVAEDVAKFLEDPANQDMGALMLEAALSACQEKVVESHRELLKRMTQAADPGSRLGMLRTNIPQLVEVLNSFRGDKEIDSQRNRSARACVTREVTQAVARATACAISAPDPRSVWRSVESRLCEGVFNLLADRSDRLAAYRHRSGGFQSLFEDMLVFQDEPEMHELRCRAVQACCFGREGAPPDLLDEVDLEMETPSEADSDPPEVEEVSGEGRLMSSVRVQAPHLELVYDTLRDDSDTLWKEYHNSRSDAELDIGPWEPDSKGGLRRRVSYKVRLLGFPAVPCQEQQRLFRDAKGSVVMRRRAEPTNSGVSADTQSEFVWDPSTDGIRMDCTVSMRAAGTPMLRVAESVAEAAARAWANFAAHYHW